MAEVVTLSDMRAALGLTDDFGSADDGLIQRAIDAATAHTARAAGVDFDELAVGADGVPADLRLAVQMLAAHWFENREATIVGVSAAPLPLGFDDLIRPHRPEWF